MFNKTVEKPLHPIINSGLYKLSIPYFLGQSVPDNETEGHRVYHFPVEAYIQRDNDLAKGIMARFVIYEEERRLVGDWYYKIATILRRAYFTALFIPDHPEKIKWIEYRSASRSDIYEEEIYEIELEWDKDCQWYSFVGMKRLNNIFD